MTRGLPEGFLEEVTGKLRPEEGVGLERNEA